VRVAAARPHLFVLNERDLDNPRAGGAEVNLFEIFGRLAERGYPVTLVCAGYRGAGPVGAERGVAIRRVGNRYSFYVRGPMLFRRLAREVAGPAILVENLCKLPFYGPLYSPFPVLAVVHHLFGSTAFRQVSWPVAAVTYLSELGIPPIYRKVPMVAVSESTREDLVTRGVRAENITVIPNGLDHAHYRPDGTEPGPLILSLGRIEPYKRVDLIVEAMPAILAAVPGARFVVVGRGDAVPALERQVARLGLGHAVEFRGFVSEDEKVALYRAARVFVNPSEKEGWGLTVMEANACGAPAVASDVPGLRDSVRNERTGLLVPYGDLDAWTAAMLRLLREEATWRRLRAGALEWAAGFTWDAVADQTQALVEGLASAQREASGA
jgi:glycosyltransferase involved in cell wall biosynthesis